MGRKHGQLKRKRKTIDLNSLTKKERKIYRGGSNTRQAPKDEEKEEVADVEEEEEIEEESSEDECSPFQQFVATFSAKPTAAIDTDEEESDDSEGSNDLEESQSQINKKIKILEKKLQKNMDDSELDTDSDDDEVDAEDDDEVDADDDDEVEDEDEVDAEDEEEDDDDKDVDGESEEDEDLDDGEVEDGTDLDPDDDSDKEESSEDDLVDEDCNEISLTSADPFLAHFEKDIDEKDVNEMSSCTTCKQERVKVSGIGETKYTWTCDREKSKVPHRKEKALVKQHVKESLCKTLATINENVITSESPDGLTSFQMGLFSILNNYQDLLYTERTSENGEEIRQMYCLHALNHILKTRGRVILNSTKVKKKENTTEDFDIRDQGLTRPKVLMVLPFRESVCRVVEMLIKLTGETEKSLVDNKTRFFEEYGHNREKPGNTRKPEDFQQMFTGNCDDHFRIGIGIAKKTMKLYTQFYKADIIIASPLGMRTLIKTEHEKDGDYDFLNSIEVLIVDQADVLMMQNWEHVLHLMNHMHLQPKESHDVDFSRVRMWTLNGWSKYYRQSLVFSGYSVPEVNALFNKRCFNYAGKYTCIRKPSTGTICQVAVQVPQVFHRIECTTYTEMPEERFNFFIKKVLPQHFDSLMAQTLIYIPSYFDFVRLRNHFTREEITYAAVNEYTREKEVNTSRNLFFQKLVPFLLYTERFHFFKRVNITGIRHIIFYGLPQYPHFYSEMCNMVQTDVEKTKGDNHSCTVLYTKYEAQRLAEIVGSDRAGKMLHSGKSVHMFVTGEND